MTTARCPACGASVLDGAPWCTLCYTDLRAPAVAPASAVEVVPAQAAPADPVPQLPTGVEARPATPASSLDLLDPRLDSPVVTARHAAERGPARWPCLTCGGSNELDHDACAQCGTPFLAGADPAAAVDLPLVGPIRPLTATKSSRAWLMIGGGLAVCVVLTIVLSIIGLLL